MRLKEPGRVAASEKARPPEHAVEHCDDVADAVCRCG